MDTYWTVGHLWERSQDLEPWIDGCVLMTGIWPLEQSKNIHPSIQRTKGTLMTQEQTILVHVYMFKALRAEYLLD